MTLQEYFQAHAAVTHTIEHVVAEDDSVRVRIYPTGVEGHVKEFQVKGNELVPIEKTAPTETVAETVAEDFDSETE